MTISINGYTRHQNGHLVTVHGYDTNARDAATPGTPDGTAVRSQPENLRRAAMGMAPPGVHPVSMQDQSAMTGGITTYQTKLLRPSKTIVRWRKSILPVKGAYQIPKQNPPGGTA